MCMVDLSNTINDDACGGKFNQQLKSSGSSSSMVIGHAWMPCHHVVCTLTCKCMHDCTQATKFKHKPAWTHGWWRRACATLLVALLFIFTYIQHWRAVSQWELPSDLWPHGHQHNTVTNVRLFFVSVTLVTCLLMPAYIQIWQKLISLKSKWSPNLLSQQVIYCCTSNWCLVSHNHYSSYITTWTHTRYMQLRNETSPRSVSDSFRYQETHHGPCNLWWQ